MNRSIGAVWGLGNACFFSAWTATLPRMTRVLLLGAGNIGVAIADLLSASGDYDLTAGDLAESRLAEMPEGVHSERVDVTDDGSLREAMRGMDVVVSACPFDLNLPIAEAARELSVHYFDLTEDVETTRRIREIAADAEQRLRTAMWSGAGFHLDRRLRIELTKGFDSRCGACA